MEISTVRNTLLALSLVGTVAICLSGCREEGSPEQREITLRKGAELFESLDDTNDPAKVCGSLAVEATVPVVDAVDAGGGMEWTEHDKELILRFMEPGNTCGDKVWTWRHKG